MYCLHFTLQDGVKTLGDIYEAVIETEHPAAEAVQLFDTPGDVSYFSGWAHLHKQLSQYIYKQ